MRLLALLVLLPIGCATPQVYLTPETIGGSAATAAEKKHALETLYLAVELANEFLSSSFNETLPANARVELTDGGLQLVTPERVVPVPVLLTDDFPKSSCICAHVDTRHDVVHAFRPWRADESLPIETCNDFLDPLVKAFDEPEPNLTRWVLYTSSALYFDREAHISSWEWFKCQRLEWLIGSGHHRESMELPGLVFREFWKFWYEVDPLTPTVRSVLERDPEFEKIETRRRLEAEYRRATPR